MKNRSPSIKDVISRLTTPHSIDPDTALMEYMTKMVLIVLTLVSLSFSVITLAGLFFNVIPLDTFLIIFLLSIFFMLGWFLANRGRWRTASLIPPVLLLASAIYGNYIGGIDAPAMLIYVLAILFVAVLRGVNDMYWALSISLAAYLSLGLAHRQGLITQIRSGESAFINRIIITMAVIISISLLVRFLIIQFRKALKQARDELIEKRIITGALLESEKKYRELVQNANSIILRMNTRGEITFFNEYAENFFGFAADEILGRHVVGTIVPEKDTAGRDLRHMIDTILQDPSPYQSNENENITRDGHRVWVNWANKPITDREGNLSELLCVGNDITERNRALEEKDKMQAQLIHVQKMEAIGTLTSGLAHDFNNILSGIMGSLSLLDILLKKEHIDRREKVEKYIHTALDSSQRATNMIRQLLLISRKQEIKLSPIDIKSSIEHIHNICSNSLPKSVRMNVQAEDRPLLVMADTVFIEQILLNFCVNASHAMTIMRENDRDSGGNLDITISSVRLPGDTTSDSRDEYPPGRYVRIEVKDTGVGMNEETQKRIFEPFFTTKSKEQGTGLGLSTAYGFVHRLGGFIEVNSRPGEGSTFSIYLPELEQTGQICNENEKGKELVRGSGTILVIDDETPVLAVAEETLVSSGYNVLTAPEGIRGIELFRERKNGITAVLLDISMPFMSGLEVFERLREIDRTVKVILSSGYADDERVTRGLELGAAGFIRKPYTAVELSESIHQILNGGFSPYQGETSR